MSVFPSNLEPDTLDLPSSRRRERPPASRLFWRERGAERYGFKEGDQEGL
jgi:hypothetical protein